MTKNPIVFPISAAVMPGSACSNSGTISCANKELPLHGKLLDHLTVQFAGNSVSLWSGFLNPAQAPRVTRTLSLREVLILHERIASQSGGGVGVRDLELLESAVAQPRQSFDGSDLQPSIVEKAAALGFSLISNHPFVDGNKRVGHAALEVFLLLNGHEIDALVDEQERVILAVAAGKRTRETFTRWVKEHVRDALDATSAQPKPMRLSGELESLSSLASA